MSTIFKSLLLLTSLGTVSFLIDNDQIVLFLVISIVIVLYSEVNRLTT